MPPAEDTTVLSRASLHPSLAYRLLSTSSQHSSRPSKFTINHVWPHGLMPHSFTCPTQSLTQDAVQRVSREMGQGDGGGTPGVFDPNVSCADSTNRNHVEEAVPVISLGTLSDVPTTQRDSKEMLQNHCSHAKDQRLVCVPHDSAATGHPLCKPENALEEVLEAAKKTVLRLTNSTSHTSPATHIDPSQLGKTVSSTSVTAVANLGFSQANSPQLKSSKGEGYHEQSDQATYVMESDGVAPPRSQCGGSHDTTGGGVAITRSDSNALDRCPGESSTATNHTCRVLERPQQRDFTSSATLTTEAVATCAVAQRAGTEDDFRRPAKALSVCLVALYKRVNAQYCFQCRQALPGPKYNNGYDDKEGHYYVIPGEEILQRYSVQETLGKGSFGTVVRCFDEKRREMVALKITRLGTNFRNQAKVEADMLLKLNGNPNLNHLVVKLLKVFDWQGHLVLVFELLSSNLYQLIKFTRYNGVSLDLVRKFAYQLLHALLQLELHKPHPIIHCDIKPENILLRNQNRSGIRLIDFGSACYANRRVHRYIQSRFYRSPEVILNLGYSTAIDRWSLGCVLVELHTGVPLFDGLSEAAQLARFEAVLGTVPFDMISMSPCAAKFYSGDANSGFLLKEPALPRRSLESILGVTTGGPRGSRKGTPGHHEKAYREFLDFVSHLLRYHPEERLSCSDALRHPFVAPLYVKE